MLENSEDSPPVISGRIGEIIAHKFSRIELLTNSEDSHSVISETIFREIFEYFYRIFKESGRFSENLEDEKFRENHRESTRNFFTGTLSLEIE